MIILCYSACSHLVGVGRVICRVSKEDHLSCLLRHGSAVHLCNVISSENIIGTNICLWYALLLVKLPETQNQDGYFRTKFLTASNSISTRKLIENFSL